MAFIYLDDSKHPDCGFVLATFVAFQENQATSIERALRQHGLTPYVDEFKSSFKMADSPARRALRDSLRELLSFSKFGIAIASTEGRLTGCCTALFQRMIKHEAMTGEHQVFMDEGIYRSLKERQAAQSCDGAERCYFHFGQDSKICLGIQLADLAAHTAGLMMKDALGRLPKVMQSEDDPDNPIELGFLMWATLRYNFLFEPQSIAKTGTEDIIASSTLDTRKYSLMVDDLLPEELQIAAYQRFGSMYLGCIH